MQQQILSLTTDFSTRLETVTDLNQLEKIRIDFIGKKGRLTGLLKSLGQQDIETKKNVGPQLNQLKNRILERIETTKDQLNQQALNQTLLKEKLDVTLPGRRHQRGTLHPLTLVIQEMTGIFKNLGFSVSDGPEAENDFYNFEALNFPPDHPSRDMHDTFYLDTPETWLLRTHTSNVQIHLMEIVKPPIRSIMPGKVYRSDSDVSHSPVFHQIEGLYVDEGVHFGHLKATLEHFSKALFDKSLTTRLRPSFFPFTEPSVEMDVSCVICGGVGCNVCKQTGWIEILGAGMVDPAVLEAVKVDSQKYTGFAFGMGVERIAMLKYGIDNIRLLFENHRYFTEQF